jgi:catechol 2,3-dioxygenase-like lactoylglutathione lyase family enzyme
MKVLNIDHFNIRAPKNRLETVKKFYEDLLGLKQGFRPYIAGGPGIWLYADEKAVLHLSEDEQRTTEKDEDFLDHIAFRCLGADQFVEKLDALQIEFIAATIPDIDLIQLFFKDPAGITIELNFKGENPVSSHFK